MMAEYTVKEYAAKWRVTPRTVKHWIAKGAVEVKRSPGRGRVLIVDPPSRMIVLSGKPGDDEGNTAE